MEVFKAFRVFQKDHKTYGRLVEVGLDDLSEGDVVARVAYSGVNYKDALACDAHPGVARTLPLVPGIDVAGTLRSAFEGYAAGTPVGDAAEAGSPEELMIMADPLT